MATVGRDIESVELSAQELWRDGPPYELFSEMRRKCPIHWTESLEEFPEEAGFWSVTTPTASTCDAGRNGDARRRRASPGFGPSTRHSGLADATPASGSRSPAWS